MEWKLRVRSWEFDDFWSLGAGSWELRVEQKNRMWNGSCELGVGNSTIFGAWALGVRLTNNFGDWELGVEQKTGCGMGVESRTKKQDVEWKLRVRSWEFDDFWSVGAGS